jgi:predicted transporter
MDTVCAEVYVPAPGLKVGVAAGFAGVTVTETDAIL